MRDRGIASLRGYQRGGSTDPDQEEKRRRLWQPMAEQRDVPPVGIGSLGDSVDPNVLKRWLAMMDQPSDATTWAQRAPTTRAGVIEGEGSPSFEDMAMAAAKMPKDALRKLIFSSITPFSYLGHEGEISNVIDAILSGDAARGSGNITPPGRTGEKIFQGRPGVGKGRDDLFARYLELPQEHGTLVRSEYRPTQARDEDAEYSSLNPELAERLIRSTFAGSQNRFKRFPRNSYGALEGLVREIREAGGNKVFNDWDTALLGDFTMSEGSDEKGPYVSYYDKWDLDHKMARGLASLTGIGKNPPEIYGRSYYDPETFKMIGSSR